MKKTNVEKESLAES